MKKFIFHLVISIFIITATLFICNGIYSNDENKDYNKNLVYDDYNTFVSMLMSSLEADVMAEESGINREFVEDFPMYLYMVKRGDNIWNIAKNADTSVSTILSINNIEQNGNLIMPGQEFVILKGKQGVLHNVKEGDTLESIVEQYSRFGITIDDIMADNDIRVGDSIRVGENLFIPGATLSNAEILERSNPKWALPIKQSGSYVTSEFSLWRVIWINGQRYSSPHYGIDIGNRDREQTPIYASRSGRVSVAEFQTGYGRVIYIDHLDGYETRYAHLSRYFVKKGQWVRQGQLIGRMGSTGRSTGPHLHFEVRYRGTARNPRNYVSDLYKLSAR